MKMLSMSSRTSKRLLVRMLVKAWDKLPKELQLNEVRPYWEILRRKNFALFWKRVFDIVVSGLMLVILSPFFLLLAIVIKIDSKGPVFYRQVRVTQYGKEFRIHKFRSMCDGADKKGSLVTVKSDPRVTNVGRFIRKFKLDEISQLIDVFQGTMSFVGTRPEVPKYVACYTNEMKATLLLPAGITSTASIEYRDESRLLDAADDVDKVYIEEVLPCKMKFNLKYLSSFSIAKEFLILFKTMIVFLR